MADMTFLAHACYLREVERLARRRRLPRAGPGALLACLALASALALVG